MKEVQERFEVDITELPDDIDLSSYIESRLKKYLRRLRALSIWTEIRCDWNAACCSQFY